MAPQRTRPNLFTENIELIWLKSYGDEDPAIADRHRLLDTLGLVAMGLENSASGDAVRDRLALVGSALWDLDDGVTHPIFKAKELGHGKRLNSAIWRSRTVIAIALDFLMEADVPEIEALKQVSKIPGMEKLLSGKSPSKEKSPRNWRALFREGTFATDLVREQWEMSRQFLANLTGSPSERRKKLKAEAERLIAAAADEIKVI